jgi:folate-binding protein YgfZ
MYPLHSLAAIRFSGADARNFLQGQLSNDLTTLTPSQSLLASCNSAQGRVQAVLHLIERDDGIIALLPSIMVEQIITRLSKYVLRAKVSIAAVGESLQVCWAEGADLLEAGWPTPGEPGQHVQAAQISILRWPDGNAKRFVTLQPGTANSTSSKGADHDWQLADIRAGLPQVLPETHESFVAQMLNLDMLGGISFNKGCYTGQEIIARAHFRGAVKRRMLHFSVACSAPVPGSRVIMSQGNEPAGEVVMAADTAAGCELLAVISLAQRDADLCLESNGASLSPLPLPYLLPG